MKVKVNKKWIDTVDYDGKDNVVIQVTKWLCLAPVPRAYFSYPFSLKILWHYRTIGMKPIARKIVSRTKNNSVSQKFISIGKGVVEKSEGQFQVGDSVVFVATNHPEGLTRIALPSLLVRGTDTVESGDTKWKKGAHDFMNANAGFEIESEKCLEDINFSKVESILSAVHFSETIKDDFPFASARIAKRNTDRGMTNRVTIFGWGHHSRTQIAPHLPTGYLLSRIHDIDPVVLRLAPKDITIDATRRLAKNDDSSLIIVAGYHHTHADLVLEALREGKSVICEKPLATSWEQLEKLEKFVEPKLSMAYHRRYDAFFDHIRHDLSPAKSKMDYRCVVHEVSLPKNHWYNWPVSKSKIVSNGCHWIDHFLALKPGFKVISTDAFQTHQGIHCHLELEDGSTFQMMLSDKGSDEKGNREEISIEVGERTVFIKDFESYTFSKSGKKIKSRSVKKLDVFPRMYERIFKNIERKRFDDFSQVLRTQRTILALDDKLAEGEK